MRAEFPGACLCRDIETDAPHPVRVPGTGARCLALGAVPGAQVQFMNLAVHPVGKFGILGGYAYMEQVR